MKRGGEIRIDRWMELKLKKLKGAAVQHQKTAKPLLLIDGKITGQDIQTLAPPPCCV